MRITFGAHFDGPVYPAPWDVSDAGFGVACLGPAGLLHTLEQQIGLPGPSLPAPLRTDQMLRKLEAVAPNSFFSASLASDGIGTARRILFLRDELRLGGWEPDMDLPGRLATMAAVERAAIPLAPGFADRLLALSRQAPGERFRGWHIALDESARDLPGPWLRIWDKLRAAGAIVEEHAPIGGGAVAGSDLALLQKRLASDAGGSGAGDGQAFQGDGSLCIVRAPSDAVAADALAASTLMAAAPLLIVPEPDSMLQDVLHRRGLPRIGTGDSSVAHPVLQLLPLALALLWEPLDPQAVLGLLTLPVSPMNARIRSRLARTFAETPGLGAAWRRSLEDTIQSLVDKPGSMHTADELNHPVATLLGRNRFVPSVGVPPEAVRSMLVYLRTWAAARAAVDERDRRALSFLHAAAGLILGMLEHRKDTIRRPELEQLLRTAMDSGVSEESKRELGSAAHVRSPGAIASGVDSILWWNCIDPEVHFPQPFWSPGEIDALRSAGVELVTPQAKLEMAWRTWERPVHAAQRQLALFVPDTVDGEATAPHPLVDRIRSMDPKNVLHVSYDDWLAGKSPLASVQTALTEPRALPSPREVLQLRNAVPRRKEESYSSLAKLFFQPQYWVLEYAASFRSADVRLKPFVMLRGTIAHRVLQELLKQAGQEDTGQPDEWIRNELARTLQEEGLPLLLPEYAPAREQLERNLLAAGPALLRLAQRDGFLFQGSELKRTGLLGDQPIAGTIDVLLGRDNEEAIIDIKHAGLRHHQDELRENRALQLAVYQLTAGPNVRSVSGYFIVNAATYLEPAPGRFRDARVIESTNGGLPELIARMEAMLRHRQEQLDRGEVEVVLDPPEEPDGDGSLVPFPSKLYTRPEYDVILGRFASA